MSDRSDEPRQLAACIRLAESFLEQRPNERSRNVVTIIRGYVELYDYYAPGDFPWWRITELLNELGSRSRFPLTANVVKRYSQHVAASRLATDSKSVAL